jgi:hypothetical protein
VWIDYWRRLTGDRVLYCSYQEVGNRFPDLPQKDFASAVTLFLPDGEVRSGAHAVFTVLALLPGKSWMFWLYTHVPGFALIADMAYRTVARHRSFCYWAARALWGIPIEVETSGIASWIFLRTLGAIYLIAFASFGVQAAGLIGSNGISPVADYLHSLREYYGAVYWQVPTVFWLSAGDGTIKAVGIAGICLSLMLFLGLRWRVIRIALFVLYPFIGDGWSGIHGLPMGCFATRGWLPGDSAVLFASHRLALSLVAISFGVSFGRSEVG